MKRTFTILLLFVCINCVAQKVKLELNLQQDSTYYLAIDMKMDIDQLIQGTHQIVKTTVTGVTANKVMAVQDSLYKIEVSYKSIAMKISLGGKVLSFNSEDADTTNILSRLMRNMTGKPFNMLLSKRGQISEISNTENLYTDIFKGFPAIDEQRKAQALAQAKQSFNDKAIKGNFQQSFVIYPKEANQIGDKWTNQTQMEAAAISIKTNTAFKLNNISTNAYEISGQATILPDKVPDFKNSGPYFMRLRHVGGDITAKLVIDKKTGWMSKSEVTKHVTGDVELKQALAGPVMMTYPIVIDANLQVTGNR